VARDGKQNGIITANGTAKIIVNKTAYRAAYKNIFEKKHQNIWQFEKNSVPLHPQFRDHLFCMPFNAPQG